MQIFVNSIHNIYIGLRNADFASEKFEMQIYVSTGNRTSDHLLSGTINHWITLTGNEL